MVAFWRSPSGIKKLNLSWGFTLGLFYHTKFYLFLYFLFTQKESTKEKVPETITLDCLYARYTWPCWRYQTV
jgi:hypothetical protein